MRIAAVQSRQFSDDAPGACAAIVRHLRRAADERVGLLLLPEAFLHGHSYDPATIRLRAAAAGDAVADLCRHAADFDVTLIVGAFELVGEGICNTALVIEQGRVVGRYAKAYPNESGVVAGKDFPIFSRSGVRYGINICNDANHPDAAQRITDQDAALLLYPLNNMLPPETAERWREKSMANLIDRARQTGCWIASSDVAGAQAGLMSFGCTAIVAPDGNVVARVPELIEGVVVYDIAAR